MQTFEELLPRIAEARVDRFLWKSFEGSLLRGCHRAEYVLVVDPGVYDALFNAPAGLRGQFALSPSHGEAANRRILDLLGPALMAFERASDQPSDHLVQWSICGSQAKVWIDETEVELQLGGLQPEILYPPWTKNSETGVGLLAPQGTRLEIKGAWIDPTGLVVHDPAKAGRSEEIHEVGFS